VDAASPRLQQAHGEIAAAIDRSFAALLPGPPDSRDRLFEAMRYAAIGGGKRCGRCWSWPAAGCSTSIPDRALRAGLAVECIHVYSLIHDDLPCMDDDDLRRGKPTVHRAFDECTAILAGDSLHALAFESWPTRHARGSVRARRADRRARPRRRPGGMAGGQMMDLMAGDGRSTSPPSPGSSSSRPAP
jgi:farnesyl diphosphate synthase